MAEFRGKREPQHVRQLLREVLPLKAPFTMNINPSGICNFNCFFCPTNNTKVKPEYKAYLDKQKVLMDMETFHLVADGLAELEEQTKVIYLVGQGEPLMNPHIVDMVRILKERELCREVRIITNGSLLGPKMNQNLIDAGLDVLKVSVEALSNEGYKKICSASFDFDRLLENVKDFYSRSRGSGTVITAKILTDSLASEEEVGKFYDIFESITDYQEMRNVETYWPDFEFEMMQGSHETVEVSEMGPGGICSGMFTESNVQPNGDICLCRIDWAGNLVLGNVHKDSIRDIWDSEKRRDCLLKNLDEDRNSLGICSKCAGPCFGEVITKEDAEIIRTRMLSEKY